MPAGTECPGSASVIMQPSRRTFFAGSAAFAGAMAMSGRSSDGKPFATTREGTPAERAAMAALAGGFRRTYGVPGLAVAVARHGTVVYDEAFGVAARETGERLTPRHRFRIASVSKPITSVAILHLIEAGRLQLTSRVFGTGGVLGGDYGPAPYGRFVEAIQIEHLLTHTAGGWGNDGNDPMFRDLGLSHTDLIRRTIHAQPLNNPPGRVHAYSNFAYCVLGRVVEKLGGRGYAPWVRENVLRPLGIDDMEIAGDTFVERRPFEARYYSPGSDAPYRMKVARMDSHGGWIARAADLAVFAGNLERLLRPETVRTMTMPTPVSPGYAKGWAVNRAGSWWHIGSLPGTTSIMVRTRSGFSWGALVNASAAGADIGAGLDRLLWNMVRKISA